MLLLSNVLVAHYDMNMDACLNCERRGSPQYTDEFDRPLALLRVSLAIQSLGIKIEDVVDIINTSRYDSKITIYRGDNVRIDKGEINGCPRIREIVDAVLDCLERKEGL